MTSIQTSKLLQRLDETTADATFSDRLRVIFDQFSQRVSVELRQINQLFDEYTPHDDVHMRSLWRIADQLLGDEGIGRLNGCEACVLACAIYGHDWGMAVSQDEKERIVTGRLPSGKAQSDFALLQDEQVRWQSFARSAGIGDGADRHVKEEWAVSKDLWREYVRQTHPDRARMRAVHYFKNKDDLDKLGMPVGEVCAGHGYDIGQIRRLPTSWSIGGQSINLRALAIYMRFIDLLDIGDNRTPFALWKFISPGNAVSAMEWRKHRAISPITYRAGDGHSGAKVLQVHGETDDYIVFAALQDLKRYMEGQVQENVAALQELGAYSLGTLALEWEVRPRGFEPIDIRFEFDRSRMFDVISGEIYDGDPYIFIRELLQNAIDATELRRRRCEIDGLSLDDTVIRISVEHQPSGDATVIVTDRGTGMNLGIVRDYLAVVGRSYYRSREFEELETGMTPISRFGVGLLSCFEVADILSITTRMDSGAGGLEIEIADRSQQFRVRKVSGDGPVGTSVTIRAKASKWKKGEFSECSRLQVTDYVKAIAGFVPRPIHISEQGAESVVCSALTSDADMDALQRKFPKAEVHRQPRAYGLMEAVVPQDFETAPQILESKTFRFSSDLGSVRIEGLIDYFTPTAEVLSSTRNVKGGVGSTFNLRGSPRERPLRWAAPETDAKSGVSPSARCSPLKQIYLRGVLLPDAKLESLTASGAPPSRVLVNLAGDSDDFAPLLSRRSFKTPIDSIQEAIAQHFTEEITDCYLWEFRKSTPLERLFLLARLVRYVIPARYLLRCFPIDELPAVLLNATGTLSVLPFDQLPSEIEIAPKYLLQSQKGTSGPQDWAIDAISTRRLKGAGEIVKAHCPMVVINFGFEYDDGSPMEWNDIDGFLSSAIQERYHRQSVRLGVAERKPYMIEKLRIGKQPIRPAASRSKLDAHNIEFTLFDSVNASLMCLMPLENSQLSQNQIRVLVFNVEHPASALLKRAIESANSGLAKLEPRAAGAINDAYFQLPMIGYIHQYRSGFFEPTIAQWVRDFCFAVADGGLINLTEEDRACLRACSASSVIPCFE